MLVKKQAEGNGEQYTATYAVSGLELCPLWINYHPNIMQDSAVLKSNLVQVYIKNDKLFV